MAKKAELLAEAKELKLKVSEKNTIAEIEQAIAAVASPQSSVLSETQETGDKRLETTSQEAKPLAKAGKRSEKAIKEAEVKKEKEERKTKGDTTPVDDSGEAIIKKGPKPVTRPLIERRGKKYRELAKQIDFKKLYALSDALELASKTSPSKFDASVEIHARLGVDPRQADQNIRSTVSLPHGSGKTVRVAVFAPSDQHAAAKKAGADIIGEDDFLQQLDKELINFDVLITSPQLMPRLSKYARTLGPRGLMPNPKSGTVHADVAKAIKEAKTGKVEYRVDKQGIVHLAIGKVSFGAVKLQDNAKVFFDSLHGNKPNSLKGNYVKTITVTTTQGPGIKIDLSGLA